MLHSGRRDGNRRGVAGVWEVIRSSSLFLTLASGDAVIGASRGKLDCGATTGTGPGSPMIAGQHFRPGLAASSFMLEKINFFLTLFSRFHFLEQF